MVMSNLYLCFKERFDTIQNDRYKLLLFKIIFLLCLLLFVLLEGEFKLGATVQLQQGGF